MNPLICFCLSHRKQVSPAALRCQEVPVGALDPTLSLDGPMEDLHQCLSRHRTKKDQSEGASCKNEENHRETTSTKRLQWSHKESHGECSPWRSHLPRRNSHLCSSNEGDVSVAPLVLIDGNSNWSAHRVCTEEVEVWRFFPL